MFLLWSTGGWEPDTYVLDIGDLDFDRVVEALNGWGYSGHGHGNVFAHAPEITPMKEGVVEEIWRNAVRPCKFYRDPWQMEDATPEDCERDPFDIVFLDPEAIRRWFFLRDVLREGWQGMGLDETWITAIYEAWEKREAEQSAQSGSEAV